MPALSHPAPNSSGSGADSCASVALLHPAVMPRLLAFAGPSEFGALAGTASPLLFAALADSGRQRQLRSRWRNLVEPVHLAGPRPHPTDRTLQIATPDRAIVAAIRELLQSNEAGDLRESHRLLLDAFGRGEQLARSAATGGATSGGAAADGSSEELTHLRCLRGLYYWRLNALLLRFHGSSAVAALHGAASRLSGGPLRTLRDRAEATVLSRPWWRRSDVRVASALVAITSVVVSLLLVIVLCTLLASFGRDVDDCQLASNASPRIRLQFDDEDHAASFRDHMKWASWMVLVALGLPPILGLLVSVAGRVRPLALAPFAEHWILRNFVWVPVTLERSQLTGVGTEPEGEAGAVPSTIREWFTDPRWSTDVCTCAGVADVHDVTETLLSRTCLTPFGVDHGHLPPGLWTPSRWRGDCSRAVWRALVWTVTAVAAAIAWLTLRGLASEDAFSVASIAAGNSTMDVLVLDLGDYSGPPICLTALGTWALLLVPYVLLATSTLDTHRAQDGGRMSRLTKAVATSFALAGLQHVVTGVLMSLVWTSLQGLDGAPGNDSMASVILAALIVMGIPLITVAPSLPLLLVSQLGLFVPNASCRRRMESVHFVCTMALVIGTATFVFAGFPVWYFTALVSLLPMRVMVVNAGDSQHLQLMASIVFASLAWGRAAWSMFATILKGRMERMLRLSLLPSQAQQEGLPLTLQSRWLRSMLLAPPGASTRPGPLGLFPTYQSEVVGVWNVQPHGQAAVRPGPDHQRGVYGISVLAAKRRAAWGRSGGAARVLSPAVLLSYGRALTSLTFLQATAFRREEVG